MPPFGKAPERTEIEADPRHAELLIKNSGWQSNSKGVNTPGERPRDSSRTIKLSPQDSTSYRSNVMRLASLPADRIELQFANKELARAMAEPTTADVEALKRCIRFLLKYPRCIQSFERQEIVPKQITCYSDSNFAGCLQSRKSTSSCKFFYGKHPLKSTSTTQAVVSLSSAEAVRFAALKAAAAAIGCVSLVRDLGVVLQQQGVEVKAKGLGDGVDSPSLEIKLDATAGRAIAMRRGAGRIRHVATPTLWLQLLVINGDIKMTRVGGKDNCADLGTKHLDYQTMNRHLKFCGMCFAADRMFVLDSGASTMLSKGDLSSDLMDALRRSKKLHERLTATSEVQINEEAQVFAHDLDLFATVQLLDETLAVLSLHQLCSKRGY